MENNKPTIKREFSYVEGKDYYYLGARNAWDTVEIGLYNSKEAALKDVPWNCSDRIVKKADENRIKKFFGIYPYDKII